MTGDPFSLPPKWAGAAEQVIRTMLDGVDPRELELAEGYGSTLTVERYAREYCKVSPRVSLAMIYGIASCGVCTAGQGGWVLPCPIKGGGILEVPLIQHFIGVAPSGMRKSTALDAARRPLARALARGVRNRTERQKELRRLAERAAADRIAEEDPALRPVGAGRAPEVDRKQFATIYTAGICPDTLLKDPTVEALRDFIVANGGVGHVNSAEADVFRSLTAYSNDSGSLTFFLDLWQQEGISTARVSKGLIKMDEVALVMTVLFQNDVFADVTGGTGGKGGGDGFLIRGMFGRNWLVRAPETGGFEALAQEYGDEDDFAAFGLDGMCDENGVVTPLGDALLEYEDNLDRLVEESNAYRMTKALRMQWDLAMKEYGADLQVDEFEEVPRHAIRLDTKARRAYRRVQRMQLAIEAALASPQVEEDVRLVFNPLAARITQHIMREAFVMALGAGFRTVTEEMIEDAATRLFPWRVAHTADALLQRAEEVATVAVARVAAENPNLSSRTPDAMVLKALAKLAEKHPGQRADGFPISVVTATVRNAFNDKNARNGVSALVRTTLDRLVQQQLVTASTAGPADATGRTVLRYSIPDTEIRAAIDS